MYIAAGVVATLWPFNFLQHNLASFSPGGGLVFRQPAIAFTRTPPSKLAGLEKFTVQLRLVSFSTREQACILDYATEEHHTNLRLQQERDQLDVWIESAGSRPGAGLHIPHVFGRSDTITITVSFDGEKLHAWVAGGSRKSTQIGPGEHLRWDSTASLALGSLVDGQNGWRGEIFSLSVTDRPTEQSKSPGTDSVQGSVILSYDFTHPFQGEVQDTGMGAPATLVIPERYTVPSRIILAPPAHYNWRTRWFVFDMAGNIIVFLPFGLLGTIILFTKTGRTGRSIAITVLAAFLFSLTVELLQAWLPSRNSSMVDLFSDVTGAGIGAWCARIPRIQPVLRWLGLTSDQESVT